MVVAPSKYFVSFERECGVYLGDIKTKYLYINYKPCSGKVLILLHNIIVSARTGSILTNSSLIF